MSIGLHRSLKNYSRLLAWVLAFVLVFSPLSALASTLVDTEIRDETQWYAFAAYSEIHEVAPPPHLASLAAQVIKENSLPSNTPVNYHLVNYIVVFEQIDGLSSSNEITAVFSGLLDGIVSYDNNGNLTSDSTWTHAWNYNNQLTQSTGGSTVTYAYDHTGQRVKLVSGGTTTRYANKLYNTDGAKNVKHIYAGSQLVATLENTTLQYIHTDHLTGSNVATDSTAGMVQLLDYYPYGSMRIDWKYGSFDEQRKFTGHMYDRDTSLTYANARYYKQMIGRFLSQDPVFLAVGNDESLKAKTGLRLRRYLQNPQSFNNYSYAVNNPMRVVDSGGEWIEYFIGEQNAVSLGNWANNLYNNNSVASYAMDHPIQTGAAAGIVGGIVLEGGFKAISTLLPATPLISQQAQQMQDNARKGAEFFQRTGYTQNLERITSLTQTARYRIPDILSEAQKLIGEVKNVAYQGLTSQIKDYIAYAQQKGYTFELITRPDTILSKGLQEAVKAGEVIHKVLE